MFSFVVNHIVVIVSINLLLQLPYTSIFSLVPPDPCVDNRSDDHQHTRVAWHSLYDGKGRL